MSETTRVDRWIDELTAQAPLAERDAASWEAVLTAVVRRLIEADAWPGVDGSPWLLLDEIAHRALTPNGGARRTALEKALRQRLSIAGSVDERVFLLRQLALVGDGGTVPFLEGLLEAPDVAVREHARRAHTAITRLAIPSEEAPR